MFFYSYLLSRFLLALAPGFQHFRPASLQQFIAPDESHWSKCNRCWRKRSGPTERLRHQQVSALGFSPSVCGGRALWSVCNWSVYREGQSSTCLSFVRPVGLEVTRGFRRWVKPRGNSYQNLCEPLACWLIPCPLLFVLFPLYPLTLFLCLFHKPPFDFFLSVYCFLGRSLSLSLGVIKSALFWLVPLREGLYVPSWIPRACAHRASLPSLRLP